MPPDHVAEHIGKEQAWLAQEYGRVYRLLEPYGPAQMQQYGMVVSQDVIRDAIGNPTHPGYADVARFAVQQLDTVIGHLRAEVEERGPWTPDDIYRVTSPVYWLGQLLVFVRWLVSTNRGRIVALIGIVIGGFASGAASALVERVVGP